MMELSNVLISAVQPRWSGKRRDMTEKNVDSDAKYQYKRKISTQNNKRDPYLETMLQLCASTGTHVYL